MSSEPNDYSFPALAGEKKTAATTLTAELSQELFANLYKIIESKFVSLEAKQRLAAILESLPEAEV